MVVSLRPGRPGEASALSALALRSKGYWGYDAAFLEACRDDLSLTDSEASESVVAEVDGEVAGLALLASVPDRTDRGRLDMLFVEPSRMGSGVGGRLLAEAMVEASRRGWRTLLIDSDPGAEPFYLHHGARRVGDVASSVFPGRCLPLLELEIPHGDVE